MYKKSYPTVTEYTFFSSTGENSPGKIKYLATKQNVNKFKVEIISSIVLTTIVLNKKLSKREKLENLQMCAD